MSYIITTSKPFLGSRASRYVMIDNDLTCKIGQARQFSTRAEAEFALDYELYDYPAAYDFRIVPLMVARQVSRGVFDAA